MKFLKPLKLAAIGAIAFSSLNINNSLAASFGEQEIDQNQFIAVASPYGGDKYNLIILEQIPNKQPCWSESGSNPVVVDPLLLTFDFTGICRRSTDSNGYSIRVDGQDYGLSYLLSIVERDGELLLIGTHRSDRTQPEIIIGRTNGLTEGFLKIILEPNWRFTKRTFEGKTLGHVYLSNNQGTASNTQ